MAYKDILVFLDILPDARQRVSVALGLAKRHGARLIGVNACAETMRSGEWRERIADLPREFETEAGLRGVTCLYHDPEPNPAALIACAHHADLIVAPQPDAETAHLLRPHLLDEVLLKSGVPVLVVPPLWREGPLGETVVIAWNASREATRAIHDAMPLLKGAKQVLVFTFTDDLDSARAAMAPLLGHLAAHGVTAEADPWQRTGEMTVVEALFACLSSRQADLIVAGAYGHSKMLEGFVGGPSDDLAHAPTVPLLMTH
jgi:nucleotide-binding universal stress UspA family protein